MRTKFFSLFLALVTSVGIVSAEIIEEVQIGDLYYNLDTENMTAMVDDYIEGITIAIIPNSVEHKGIMYRVTSIGGAAFYGCTSLTSLIIGSNVTNIYDDSFNGCTGLKSITCNAVTPPIIWDYVFYGVDKSIPLYVPAQSTDLYRANPAWKQFTSLWSESYTIHYQDGYNDELRHQVVMLQVPEAPFIDGFTFIGWQASGMLEDDGIILKAVYSSGQTSAPEVVNPANKNQKLIRNGNVYVLTDTKTYTVQGQEVR